MHRCVRHAGLGLALIAVLVLLAAPVYSWAPTLLPAHQMMPRQSSGLDVALTVHNALPAPRVHEPVTSGVPIPRDVNLLNLETLRLLDENGQPVAAQFTPLARWGGGPDDVGQPVRWLLLDFLADVPEAGEAVYRLVDSGGALPVYPTLSVTESPEAITIDTGAAQFTLSKADGGLTAPSLTSPLIGQATGADGTVYTTTGPVTVTVALNGPMRLSIHVQGAYRDAGGTRLLDYTSRYWFYAGQATVRLFHTVENNALCPITGEGQIDCYDIGSGGGVSVADVSLVMAADLGGVLTYQAGGEGEAVSGDLTDDLRLYQDSSGTDHWDRYPTLTDWDGNALDARPRMQAYVTFQGFQTTLGETVIDGGDQATGWLSLTGEGGSWAVGVRDFWQRFPKALRARPDGTLEIGLFPDEFGPEDYAFTLRAGEHKTHEIVLAPDSAVPLSPLFAQASPAWYVDSGAFGLTALPNWTDWPEHEQYLEYQLTTSPAYEDWMDWNPNLYAAIENADFYGIFDYGDWPIDYEGYGVAPLNIKYDSDYGMWIQWARGGDARWFGLAEALDRHAADIDILHNLHEPRHWGDGIAFGHSWHDEDGFLNPHRNGGGNHPDTAYGMAGMLLTYYLTGYEKAYESALELADCIEFRLHNEWFLCEFFAGEECNGEGYAFHNEGLFEAGSRPAANNLLIAVAAYRATGDPRYLLVADAVVDWERPERQPYINGPTGEEMQMRPWMLNMYLRALAYYLEMRDEFGLPDTYDAAGSYLAFANWLHDYAWIDLDPVDGGPRAAYPYEWWFDERQGDPNDEWSEGNNIPNVNNWLLLGADAMAYAYHFSGEADYLDWGASLFRAGSYDPFFEGDWDFYSQSKETANSVIYGNLFLYEWARR